MSTEHKPFPHSITRRNFMEKSVAAGVAATAGYGMILPSKAFAAQKPKKGGQLRLAYPTPVDSIEPTKAGSTTGQTLSGALFDNLISFGANNRTFVPELATSWKAEKHGQEWVLQLRKGVKFHHGKEFKSEDVVATIMRSMDKARAGRAYRSFGPVKEAKSEGSHQVRVILDQPFSDFPATCSSRFARILPADRIERLAERPVGTGPFILKDHEQGSSTTLVRNKNYWDPNRPHVDGISFVQIAESISQQAAMRGNVVDIINTIGVETYLALKGAPGVTAYSNPSGLYQVAYTLAQIEPFKDWRVRLAFKHLIDRKALLGSALLGQGVIGNDVPLPPSDPMLIDLPQHDQDFGKAKSLLKAAGVSNLKLDMWTTSERPPSPRMALAMKEGASKIGVDINVRNITFTEYVAKVPRKKPLFTSQWAELRSNFNIFYLSYHSKGAYNYSQMETAPGVDALIEDIIAAVEPAKQKELIGKLLVKIHDRSDRIIPYFQNYFAATRSTVNGFKPVDLFDLRDIWIGA